MSLENWLPEKDLLVLVIDLVVECDLENAYEIYMKKDLRGEQAYDCPEILVVLHEYCVELPVSYKIEKACCEGLLTITPHGTHLFVRVSATGS